MTKQEALVYINDFFNRNSKLSESDRSALFDKMQLIHFPAKTLLSKPGDICPYEAYVVKGLVRTYFINDKGDEVTIHFAKEDWWVGDIASFSLQRPSVLSIETLEETYILAITYSEKEKLFQEKTLFERVFRMMIQRTHAFMLNRLVSVLSSSADVRYREFIERYPDVPQRVPQHYIASYLGISPEFLSKIRSKMAKLKE
ncbi:MAG: Crp/Fnr family transcriptional regulator [Cytophagaceae bacterium]